MGLFTKNFFPVLEKTVVTADIHEEPKDKENVEVKESPLNEVLQYVLDEDPSEPRAKKASVHSYLLKHWNYYLLNGLEKTKTKNLLLSFLVLDSCKIIDLAKLICKLVTASPVVEYRLITIYKNYGK